jgi:KDO2-lipid IV(A) lauroyltransferase
MTRTERDKVIMLSARYSYRPNLFSRERNFWLEPNALGWSCGEKEDRIAYRDVETVRLFRLFMPGESAVQKEIMWRLHLYSRSGGRLVLSPLHRVRFRSWEDRSAAYRAFTSALLEQLRRADPNFKIIAAHHWTMRLRRAVKRRLSALGGCVLLGLSRRARDRDPERSADAAGRFMRLVGPWLRGHRVARHNLAAAFPEKSKAEIEVILEGMWENFGRTIAEYAFLDRLWDYDPRGSIQNRIVLDSAFVDTMSRLRSSDGPALFFGAHLANWELPPMAPAAFGVRSAMVYRPPDSGAVADEIMQRRANVWGAGIAARPGAALRIRSALRRRVCVGMLVDQHSAGGVEVSLFGRPCKANPTLARLARKFDCPVFGARAIRLPGHRYRLELTDALVLPRDTHGKIEVATTMQLITSIIEGWIREHPEQWLWMHRRWR